MPLHSLRDLGACKCFEPVFWGDDPIGFATPGVVLGSVCGPNTVKLAMLTALPTWPEAGIVDDQYLSIH